MSCDHEAVRIGQLLDTPPQAFKSPRRATEQIADCSSAQIGQPATAQMLGPIVLEVAALAPGGEIRIAVATGVVLTMAGRQYWHRQSRARQIGRAPHRPPSVRPPGAGLRIVPAPVVEADDDVPVRPTALLAAAARSFEADHRRELRPVERIEEAEFGADRHEPSITPSRTERFPPQVAFQAHLARLDVLLSIGFSSWRG